jgi:cytochrome c553
MTKHHGGTHTHAGVAFLAMLALLGTGCGARRVPLPQLAETAPGKANVARGEYLVRTVAVCGHCHAADPKRDPDGVLSGGMEFRNWRLGTARAANLTSDVETGLGAWTEAEIVRALRNGQRRDGRLLAPVMPYEWFHQMSDEDALAVSRYLKTLPAVRNQVNQNTNFLFKLGKLFFLRPKKAISAAAPPRAATAEYGGYIGSWSEEDFLRTIRTGVDPAGQTLHSFMPWEQTSRMSDEDLRAIYLYLRSLRAIRNEVPRRATAGPVSYGLRNPFRGL